MIAGPPQWLLRLAMLCTGDSLLRPGHGDAPDIEAGLWYFYYFLTERWRTGLTANRDGIARVI